MSVKDLGKLQIKDMEVQRGGRWANKKYRSCTEMQKLEPG